MHVFKALVRAPLNQAAPSNSPQPPALTPKYPEMTAKVEDGLRSGISKCEGCVAWANLHSLRPGKDLDLIPLCGERPPTPPALSLYRGTHAGAAGAKRWSELQKSRKTFQGR